jgi:hypothetical protein
MWAFSSVLLCSSLTIRGTTGFFCSSDLYFVFVSIYLMKTNWHSNEKCGHSTLISLFLSFHDVDGCLISGTDFTHNTSLCLISLWFNTLFTTRAWTLPLDERRFWRLIYAWVMNGDDDKERHECTQSSSVNKQNCQGCLMAATADRFLSENLFSRCCFFSPSCVLRPAMVRLVSREIFCLIGSWSPRAQSQQAVASCFGEKY